MYNFESSMKISKLWLVLISSFLYLSSVNAEKVCVTGLETVGGTQHVTNFPSFNSFNFVVGNLCNEADIVLWETKPANFNCHFHSMEPFFDFAGKKYWLDSGIESNSLNQGIDAFEIFLDNYFERFAFKLISADLYYMNKDLSKKSLIELDLQENDVLVFTDVTGVMVHSSRFIKYKDGDAVTTSKMGGGPIEIMPLTDLIDFYSYANLYEVRIFRFKK